MNEKQDYIAPPVLAQPTHVTEVSDSPAVVPRKKLEEDDVQERQLTFASSTTLGASTRNAPPPTSTTSRITQQPRKPRQTVIQVPQVEPRREDKELPHVSHAPDMTDIANALTDIQQVRRCRLQLLCLHIYIRCARRSCTRLLPTWRVSDTKSAVAGTCFWLMQHRISWKCAPRGKYTFLPAACSSADSYVILQH